MTQTTIKVVFTGPAKDGQGHDILRATLVEIAQRRGYQVQASMSKDTQALVASRTDTVKAQKAAQRGLPVWTYPQFLAFLNDHDPVRPQELQSQAKPHPYVDGTPKFGHTLALLKNLPPQHQPGVYDKPWPPAFDVL
jgi:hypothetical protein